MGKESPDGWNSLSSLLEVLGMLFLGVALYYLGYYLIESTNPYRNEYMMGVVMGLMIDIPFWLLNFFILTKIKEYISRFRYWFTLSMAIITILPVVIYVTVGFFHNIKGY